MKAFDIAIKDMTRFFRNASALVFMFGIPLLVTGMFYFMFGNIAQGGDFNLPHTKVIVANLDEGGPDFQVNTKNIPGGKDAKTMGAIIVGILQSDKVSDLIDVSLAPSAEAARAAVDNQVSQVALIISSDFSKQFADPNGKAVIQFYQDPTLTIGPAIMRSILNRFTEGMAGVKIAADVFIDDGDQKNYVLIGQVIQEYLDVSLAQADDAEEQLLLVRAPTSLSQNRREEKQNALLRLITPIMGGMMVFYAFFTGTSTAQSILREEEERTLPRLFTTPTPQTTILTGKLMAVFLTVLVQVTTLIIAARLIFGIQWGDYRLLALAAFGTVCSASSFGIFVNSFLKNTKQGGVIFGGVLTITGMLGMISVFAQNSPGAEVMSNTVALLVPQGWAIRGLMQAINSQPPSSEIITASMMLVWSAVFFGVGVWRFNRRYA